MHPVPPCARAEDIERFLLAVEYFDSTPTPSPLLSVSSTGDTQGDCEIEAICCGEMGKGVGVEPKSSDRKKAWPSINS
jgi:hypothetical protein